MLQITKRADYAVRLMVEVAAHDGPPITTAEIAERQEIPYQFLRKVAQDLAGRGLLASERGGRGGLSLARQADEISVLDILRALDLPPINDCSVDPENCARREKCAVFGVWFEAQRAIDRVLSTTTLSKLARGHRALQPRTVAGKRSRKAYQRDSIGLFVTGQMAHGMEMESG